MRSPGSCPPACLTSSDVRATYKEHILGGPGGWGGEQELLPPTSGPVEDCACEALGRACGLANPVWRPIALAAGLQAVKLPDGPWTDVATQTRTDFYSIFISKTVFATFEGATRQSTGKMKSNLQTWSSGSSKNSFGQECIRYAAYVSSGYSAFRAIQ
eukprot:1160627-Pelagomonas_calceolata.AAC.5